MFNILFALLVCPFSLYLHVFEIHKPGVFLMHEDIISIQRL